MSSQHFDVVVVGAGASGCSAAIHAARLGASCVVFEKQKAALRKVIASGNGQCNITNRAVSVEHYHGSNTEACRSVFSRFDVEAAFDFFASLGLHLREKDDGRIYPYSMQSATVERAILEEMKRRNIEIHLHRKISKITPQGNSLLLETEGHEHITAGAVVLACGSRAFGPLGGAADVYDLCRAIGHSVSATIPSLLPLSIKERNIRRLEGIKWDVLCRVLVDGRKRCEAEGELLFTKYGISGPVVIDISGCVNRSLCAGDQTLIEIDFFPAMSEDEAGDFLAPVFELYDNQDPVAALELIFKKRMAPVLLEGKVNCTCVEAARLLKHYRLTPDAPRTFDEAMVCAGGIPLSEISTKTFESKKLKNLFLCGEVLDIDGDCGGFNLHFAWATGSVAGIAAATSSLQNHR